MELISDSRLEINKGSFKRYIGKLQVLQKRLDEVEKSTETLSERLDKAREENDDLRFQVIRIIR